MMSVIEHMLTTKMEQPLARDMPSPARQRALTAAARNGGRLERRNGWWRGNTDVEQISGGVIGDLERDGYLIRQRSIATLTPAGISFAVLISDQRKTGP